MQDDERCSVSTSISRTCQTDQETGELRCETLKRLYRHCPGQPPVLVQEEHIQGDSAAPHSSPFGGDGSQNNNLPGPPSMFSWGLQQPGGSRSAPEAQVGMHDPFQMMQQMEQRMEAMMSSMLGGGGLFGGPMLGPPSGRGQPPGMREPSQPPPQASPQAPMPRRPIRIDEA